jgi:hypothetical protein
MKFQLDNATVKYSLCFVVLAACFSAYFFSGQLQNNHNTSLTGVTEWMLISELNSRLSHVIAEKKNSFNVSCSGKSKELKSRKNASQNVTRYTLNVSEGDDERHCVPSQKSRRFRLSAECGEIVSEFYKLKKSTISPFDTAFREKMNTYGLSKICAPKATACTIPGLPNKKSCALIGSSSLVFRHKCGKSIDKHDVIIRVGDSIHNSFEDYVGSRTDIRILNEWGLGFMRNLTANELVFNIDPSNHLVNPASPVTRTYHQPMFSKHINFSCAYRSCKSFIVKPNERRVFKKWLPDSMSSGSYSVLLMLRSGICSSISVYGLSDLEEMQAGYLYYFKPILDTLRKVTPIKRYKHTVYSQVPPHHPNAAEFNLIRKMSECGLPVDIFN